MVDFKFLEQSPLVDFRLCVSYYIPYSTGTLVGGCESNSHFLIKYTSVGSNRRRIHRRLGHYIKSVGSLSRIISVITCKDGANGSLAFLYSCYPAGLVDISHSIVVTLVADTHTIGIVEINTGGIVGPLYGKLALLKADTGILANYILHCSNSSVNALLAGNRLYSSGFGDSERSAVYNRSLRCTRIASVGSIHNLTSFRSSDADSLGLIVSACGHR